MSVVTESHDSPANLLTPAVRAAPLVDVADASLFLHWRWSVEKYHEMVRAGVISEDDQVELLEGWIVEKMTKSPLHRKVTHSLRKALEHCIPEGWYVDSQEPVTLASSEPEPDAVVVRGSSNDFGERHPGPGDIALVAEVTDSSLPRDRVFKKRIYAAAGIAVYWVVNLVDRQIEVYSDCSNAPSGSDYARCDIFTGADNVPLVVDGRTVAEIPARAILP
jgi:Uma2 family endonuclease